MKLSDLKPKLIEALHREEDLAILIIEELGRRRDNLAEQMSFTIISEKLNEEYHLIDELFDDWGVDTIEDSDGEIHITLK